VREAGPGCPAWAERYEALRAHATGEAPLGVVPLELALLLQRGVAAWMAACRSAPEAERRPLCRRPEGESGGELGGVQRELVQVLAAAALTAAQERAR
jgi:hypothetical protein